MNVVGNSLLLWMHITVLCDYPKNYGIQTKLKWKPNAICLISCTLHQLHVFASSFNMAKWNLSEVNLKPMQSAAAPTCGVTPRSLQHASWLAYLSCCISADLRRSFAFQADLCRSLAADKYSVAYFSVNHCGFLLWVVKHVTVETLVFFLTSIWLFSLNFRFSLHNLLPLSILQFLAWLLSYLLLSHLQIAWLWLYRWWGLPLRLPLRLNQLFCSRNHLHRLQA